MEEIATLSSQLSLHLRVKKLEDERKKKQEKKAHDEKLAADVRIAQEGNLEDQLKEDAVIDREEAVMKALVQEVISEHEETGNPLPKSVLRLLHYFKSRYFENDYNFFLNLII